MSSIEEDSLREVANANVCSISFDHHMYLIFKQIKAECENFISNNPQLAELMTDFTAAVLVNKPDDIRAFARLYFSTFKQDR